MNCKQIQEVLPLFVGHDLEEKKERKVAAHVQSCLECFDAAKEFRETRQLLREYGSPEISQQVYGEIRWHVLQEIQAESAQLSLRQVVINPFRPRLAWALASMLIVVLMLAVYFTAGRRKGEQALADKQPAMAQPNVNREPEQRLPGQKPAPNPSTQQPRVPDKHWMARRFQPRKSRDLITVRGTQLTGISPPTNLAEPNLFPVRDTTASKKTLRIDIQTKDPNIRIIWFSQPNTKLDLPSSKGI